MAIVNYLYLFYGSYLEKEEIDPWAVINKAKQDIKVAGLRKLQEVKRELNNQRSNFESDLEELYELTPKDFQATLESTPAMKILNSYDEAQRVLEEALTGTVNTLKALNAINQLVLDMDTLLIRGAQLGGLAIGSVEQARSYRDRIFELREAIKWGTSGTKNQKDSIAKIGTAALNSLSGSLLEIAAAIGWMEIISQLANADKSVMEAIGKRTSKNFSVTTIADPNLEEIRQQIEATLANPGEEGKADNFIVNKRSVSADASWASFQTKNYKDPSKINITSVKTYADLQIGRYFDWKFLINTAGGLGDNHLQDSRSTKNKKEKDQRYVNVWRLAPVRETTAGEIDVYWGNIQQQARVLGAADAIAARGAKGLSVGLDYYIIRHRYNGNVRIIPTAEILENMILAYQSTGDFNALGVKNGLLESDNSKGARMRTYGDINAKSFVHPPNGPDIPSGWQRSMKAWTPLYNKIADTKVSISLNLSSFFR